MSAANPVSDYTLLTGKFISIKTEQQPTNDLNPNSPPNFLMSWLLAVLWGDDSTVSVVDHTPVLGFRARPAAFGPASDVLGYMIKVEDFSAPCGGTDNSTQISTDGNDSHDDTNSGTGHHDKDYDYDRELALNSTEAVAWNTELRQGCAPICFEDNKRPEFSERWIALVMRGGCTFVEKIREAQRLGAKGVVVGGENAVQDTQGDGLVQMYSLGDSNDLFFFWSLN